jgi:hypothetical protein
MAFRKVLPVKKQSTKILTDNVEKDETADVLEAHCVSTVSF